MTLRSEKCMSLAEARIRRAQLRAAGAKLVLTNGCFDLLHVGHVDFLQQARALGDQLWVCLNADVSVRSLKGPNRPICDENARAQVLAALEAVDAVILFSTPRLDAEIRALAPDIYAKAGDYSLETLDAQERNALEETGVSIRFLPFRKGFSTTELVEKIRRMPAF